MKRRGRSTADITTAFTVDYMVFLYWWADPMKSITIKFELEFDSEFVRHSPEDYKRHEYTKPFARAIVF